MVAFSLQENKYDDFKGHTNKYEVQIMAL